MLEKYPGERATFYINCTSLLGEAETISGTPVFVSFPSPAAGSAALTFESISVNNAPSTLPDGTIVATGKLISVIIGGGQSMTDRDARLYSVVATIGTNAGNTVVSKSLLNVLPLGPV